MFTELSVGCWSSGHSNVMYQVSSSSAFLGQLHAHTCPLLLEVVCCCFPRKKIVYILLNMPMFVGSQSFISQPSFMFVSAPVSEIHELNQNSEIRYFHLSWAYNLPIFNQRYLLSTCMHSIC